MTQWVLASDGRPFSDRDAAGIKRDLLSQELGNAVKLDVVPHPAGGYAVACARGSDGRLLSASPPDAGAWMQDDLLHPSFESDTGAPPRLHAHAEERPNTAAKATSAIAPSTARRAYPDLFRLSPAARAFLGQHVLALVGAYFLIRPHDFLLIVGIGVPTNVKLAAPLLVVVMFASLILTMVSLCRFVWAYTANTYVIDRTGVVQVQWYFERGRLRRRSPRVNFAHLRTADVDQTLVQMLLNVGTLRLASGATDTYELNLKHVSAPRQLQAEFQRRLREATAPTSATGRDTDL